MDPRNYRSIIYYLAGQGKEPKKIFEELVAQYGQDAPSKPTVVRWVQEFKWGRTDLENRPQTGRPPEAMTHAKINAARLSVARNPRISTRMLAEELGLAAATTKTLLEQHLGMIKMLARWVPHTLSASQKTLRVAHGQRILDSWGHRWSRLRSRLVTMDETLMPYNEALTRESAGEWRLSGSRTPEVPRLQQDRQKSMAIVFWDAEGLIHLEWFQSTKEQRGISGPLYEAILDRFHASMRAKRADKIKRGVLLLQDNAPCHKTLAVGRKLAELGIKEIDHPPYSPDLAPSDYYLFRVLKQHRKGRPCTSHEEMDRQVRAWFASKPGTFYAAGIDALKERSERVVEARGAYLND